MKQKLDLNNDYEIDFDGAEEGNFWLYDPTKDEYLRLSLENARKVADHINFWLGAIDEYKNKS